MRRTAAPLALLLLALAPTTVLAHGAEAPPPALPAVLLLWRFDPLVVAPLAAAAAAYVWAARTVNRSHPRNPHPRVRTWCFIGGLGAIGVALASPIEAYEGVLFSVHMVQHLLLMLVAAPLVLAGGPITLTLRVSTPSVRRKLLWILHSPPVKAISFPLVAWLLFAAVNWGWHFSALYDEALENELLHYVQHASFLAAALLFWWPIAGVDPSPWRMPYPVRLFYLFLALPQNSFLGVALLSTGTILYPHYLTNDRAWGPTPLDDQHLGGILMWVAGDIAFLIGMAAVIVVWMRVEERRTARIDERLAAERAASGEEPWTPSATRGQTGR